MPLTINNADITTLECALLERVFYCKVGGTFVEPPVVSNDIYTTRLAEFTSKLCALNGTATPVSLNTIVEMYQGRKRTIYENAQRKLELSGLTRKDGYIKTFVKLEKVKKTGAPRCIQPRDPKYTLSVAAYLKPLEHRIYNNIRKIFKDGPTVIKGYNVEQIGCILRGKWRSFVKPVAIGLDAVKFDLHVSAQALKWEHSVYENVYKDKQLSRLLAQQIDQRGVGWCKDGKLRYKLKGRRASGDINTGLGNCLIMCGLVYSYAKHIKIDIKLANNGDDCVVFMESGNEANFMAGLDAWFLDMGFRMTAEAPVYELAQVEFCQMRPISMADGRCIMVRNIPTSLRKDSLCTVSIQNAKALRGWMTAVGQGGLALTGGVPIMQNFYRCLERLGEKQTSKVVDQLKRNSGMHMLATNMKGRFVKPSDEARLEVFIAWGILPDLQIEMEKYYDGYQLEEGCSVLDNNENYNHIFHALSW